MRNPAQIVLNQTGIEQVVTRGHRDANRHVSNVFYFRYMENARVEFYRPIGKYELKFLAPRCQEF